jgi:branched-chain amino acid transport system permease protein
MQTFVAQVISGLSTGGIYASIALALVLIYQSTGLVNFAQGEMAMFTTYMAWSMLNAGWGYWPAFVGACLFAFALGFGLERLVIRPLETAPELALVIVTIGLLTIFNSVAGWIYTYTIKPFPSPFPAAPIKVGFMVLNPQDLGVVGVTLLMLALIYLFFHSTRLGLAMRAVVENPVSSRLVGIRVSWMLALGWGMAAVVGAVAGLMVAPLVFLEPNMMGGVLIYAFASATLGGFSSAGGAVVGGFVMGILENLTGTYITLVGTKLKLTVALAVIVLVLLIKPTGLFGRAAVRRV